MKETTTITSDLLKNKNTLTFPALASLTLAACGGGGGGGALITPTPPTNRAPTTAGTTTLTTDEDSIDAALGITTPTDADGDSLTITVTGLPTGGTLTTADGTEVTNNMTLTISQLTGLVFKLLGRMFISFGVMAPCASWILMASFLFLNFLLSRKSSP